MQKICFSFFTTFLIIAGCSMHSKDPVEGTWELISADWIFGDTLKFPNSRFDREIKIISDKYFLFIRQDTTNNDLFFSGGGTYSYENNRFTEVMEFTSWGEGIGHASSFNCKFDGDTWIMTGPIEKTGKNKSQWQLYEEWKKIE